MGEPIISSVCPDTLDEDSMPSQTETETESEEQVDGPTSERRYPHASGRPKTTKTI